MPKKPAPHPDDEAVDRFAVAMKAKLAKARAKGRSGWESQEEISDEELATFFMEHMDKSNAGNLEDLANFLMMLHQRGASPKVLHKAFLSDALQIGSNFLRKLSQEHAR